MYQIYLLTSFKNRCILVVVDWKQSLSFYSLGASKEVPFALYNYL